MTIHKSKDCSCGNMPFAEGHSRINYGLMEKKCKRLGAVEGFGVEAVGY
jgi:hypothetical protein